MARVRESPWSLKLAAVGSLPVLFGPAAAYAPARPFVGSIVLVGALFVFVLIGSRVAWAIAVILMTIGVYGTMINGVWWEVAARLLILLLLLLPSSRRFVWRRREKAHHDLEQSA
ncbi:MAG TPA: hypothetical protein VHQ97_06575 [Solirubrobacterales bacterium]|jgi:hypothetical protein|nr:hypothetical protein [Solirubrobacterales bacterium]